MDKMTAKQKRVYDYIVQFQTDNGYPPSIREICTALGLSSTATVHGYIKRLEKNGMLQRKGENKRRTMTPTDMGATHKYSVIPMLGKITAGQPILAVETYDETIVLPSDMTRGMQDIFALSVRGDSMIECGILNGDRIIVHKTDTAEDGDIVVALIGEEATVKRFFKEKDYIRLQPENSNMEPILVKNVKILGKVIGLTRSLI